jgi:zinc protease
MVSAIGPVVLAGLVVGAASDHGTQSAWHGDAGLGDSSTTMFETSGVRVIHRRTTANDVVAVNLYLLGGTQEASDSTAGIEPLLLDASESGTRKYSREALRREMAALGSNISIEPREDWTVFGFRAVTATLDSTWMLFAERLAHPILDSASIELVRAQMVSAAAQRRADPDGLVAYLADSIAFAGHPYGLSPEGTERSLRRITRPEVQRFHAERIMTSRMLLVVVGNVERRRIERLVAATLGQLPHGAYEWRVPTAATPREADIVFVQRPLPTNYVLGYYQGPVSSTADYQALRVATAVLSGNLFNEIRARRNLSYAVEAPFLDRALAGGGLYVTTAFPDSTLRLMRRGIDALQRSLVDTDGLKVLVQQFITEYFLDNETNTAQADFLARSQLYRGDYRQGDRFVDELRQVTPSDIQRVAQRYMRGVRFAYVGDSTKITRALIARFN